MSTLLIVNSRTISLNDAIPMAFTNLSLKSIFFDRPVNKILKRWALIQESFAPGYFYASSRYSNPSLSRSIICPEKRAGFYSKASELITPSTFV